MSYEQRETMKNSGKTTRLHQLIFGITLLCTLAAIGGQDQPKESTGQSPADGLEVKVVSFNILYYRYWGPRDIGPWTARRKMVVNVIENSGADVMGLQEATFPQIEYLRGKLEDTLGILVTYREGLPIDKALSNAILYRKDRLTAEDWGTFWFSDTPDEPGSKGWGNRTPRLCTWAHFVETGTGKDFYVYNAHIDHAIQNSRIRSAALIADRIAQRKHTSAPVVLMGDLNAHEDNPIILFFKGEGELSFDDKVAKNPMPLVDSFRVAHGEEADAGTFHGFENKSLKIDYILVQKETKVLDAEILTYNVDGQYPSDHCPLTATILFR